MKGKILRDIFSTIENDFFFKKDEIVECGYHTEKEELSTLPTDYIWAENPGCNPVNSLSFLTADDVSV